MQILSSRMVSLKPGEFVLHAHIFAGGKHTRSNTSLRWAHLLDLGQKSANNFIQVVNNIDNKLIATNNLANSPHSM